MSDQTRGSDRLEQIRARAQAVLPGPWSEYDTDESWSLHAGPVQIIKAHKSCQRHAEYWPAQAEAIFIVSARDDVDWLIAEVDRLRRLQDATAINEEDLRIEVFRSSDWTGSCAPSQATVKITHLPTGIVATASGFLSQRKNKEKAMAILREKLREL